MRIQFTITDSSGAVVTDQLTVIHDGERHEIDVAGTGTTQVPDHVGEYLIESDDHAVEAYDSDTTSDETDTDSDNED